MLHQLIYNRSGTLSQYISPHNKMKPSLDLLNFELNTKDWAIYQIEAAWYGNFKTLGKKEIKYENNCSFAKYRVNFPSKL